MSIHLEEVSRPGFSVLYIPDGGLTNTDKALSPPPKHVRALWRPMGHSLTFCLNIIEDRLQEYAASPQFSRGELSSGPHSLFFAWGIRVFVLFKLNPSTLARDKEISKGRGAQRISSPNRYRLFYAIPHALRSS